MRRRALLAAAALARPARAQPAWPDRPVRVVVPFTPGGSSDILARAVSRGLSERFGQQFVVENRSGAGGTVGSEFVARAAPDGHTLLMGHIGTLAVNPALYPNLGFDTVTSFQPVIQVASVANVLVVHPQRGPRDLAGLIDRAKADPGGLTFGSGGNGSAAHIAMAAFAEATGIRLSHVPYRGTAPMMTDLIAGQIDMTMTGGPPALPPVRAGQLRALGVSALRRLDHAPDIPTIAESGVPGFEALQWYGLVAPAGTPRPVVDRLNAATAETLRDADLRSRLEAEGADAAPGTPEAFGDLIRTERARWGALVRRSGMRAD